MSIPGQTRLPGGMSPELSAAIEKLKVSRGDPRRNLERSMAVTRHIAALPVSDRVLAMGEVRDGDGIWLPAALVYNDATGGLTAYAPDAETDEMRQHHVSTFHARIPHAGIAREVLAGPEGTVAA